MAGIYTFAPPWGLSRVPMPCWQRKTSARARAILGDLRRSNAASPAFLARRRDGRYENDRLAMKTEFSYVRDEAHGRCRPPVLIVSGGDDADCKIRRNEPATNYRRYRSVIDCFTRLPGLFVNHGKRFASSVTDYATRLLNTCNPVKFIIYYTALLLLSRKFLFPEG